MNIRDVIKMDVPRKVSEQAKKYDLHFLSSTFDFSVTNFNLESIGGLEVPHILEDFADRSRRALVYHAYEGEWRIGNYAFENLAFLNNNKELRGDAYKVTGEDLSLIEGQRATILRIQPKIKTFIAPQKYTGGRITSLLVAQEYEHNRGNFDLKIICGNSWFNTPSFRDGKIVKF